MYYQNTLLYIVVFTKMILFKKILQFNMLKRFLNFFFKTSCCRNLRNYHFTSNRLKKMKKYLHPQGNTYIEIYTSTYFGYPHLLYFNFILLLKTNKRREQNFPSIPQAIIYLYCWHFFWDLKKKSEYSIERKVFFPTVIICNQVFDRQTQSTQFQNK